ncbi:MAG: sugar phosphate isomerase/epimerase family protein [Trueperaceae bacterium]
MRYLLCNETVRELDISAQCQLAAELGYDGLELAPFTLGADPHTISREQRAEVRKAAADAGISLGGLHWLLVSPEGLSITSDDDRVRRKTLDVMKRLVELCSDLDGRVLVHGSPAQRRLPDSDRVGAAERGREAFAQVAQVAEQAGVTYCIEPLPSSSTEFVNTVAEAAAIAEEIGSPGLRTMIDCRAARLSESEGLPELVSRWVPSGVIAHVHFNDRNRRAPGQGSDEFAPVIAALHEAGYQGDAAVEPFVYQPDGPTTAARAIGYLRGIEEALSFRRTR